MSRFSRVVVPVAVFLLPCAGAQGQWLFVAPKYDLVVAINAGITNGPDLALDMLFGTILPALR